LDEKIEILPVTLLDQHRPIVKSLRRLANALDLEFGWHYLLDLTWIISQLGEVKGKCILDAGAGRGVIQWYLAGKGAEVLSVDRDSRARLPLHFRLRFRVAGLRPQDLLPASMAVRARYGQAVRLVERVTGEVFELGRKRSPARLKQALLRQAGRVVIYNQDLRDLADIPDGSQDAVVAVSSLEHNPPEDLERVVAELLRVLKPGGALLATLGASSGVDWFHEPSKGWCYSEASLRRLFGLPPEAPSNYAQFEPLFADLRRCSELRDNLAAFYANSGNNGMPWGVWDPQYQPVGVVKVKRGG
jgi:SAM-dependent methyltransferase